MNLEEYPLVSLVLAVYNPDLNWFALQLDSLDAQDYPNIELIILDDASPDFTFEALKDFLFRHITHIPMQIYRNEKNLGSTKTFEKLTQMAQGKYIAYCDQDDVWDSDKIQKSVECIEKHKALLVCGDVRVIDGQGRQTASSITQINKRQVFYSGTGLAQTILFQNYVTGCTMLMEAEVAKKAIPFVEGMVHDQWLGIVAAAEGKIQVYDMPLMQYRMHGRNQTGVLSGIQSKQAYYEKRIEPFYRHMSEIVDRLPKEAFRFRALVWAKAREEYYSGDIRALGTLIQFRYFNRGVTYFEIAMKWMPNFAFQWIIQKLQKGKL